MIGAGGATPPATVKVWDPFVRVFHWSLATCFVIAYATGDEIERVHVAAGYVIAGSSQPASSGVSSVRGMRDFLASFVRRAKSSPMFATS